jgi:hypothetical protein
MSERSSFKKEIIYEAINRIRQQVNALQQEQRKSLGDVNIEDIDKGDVAESPKEQMMEEFLEQGFPLEHLNKAIEKLEQISSLDVKQSVVSFGSLVKTNEGYFLICAAFPEFSWKGVKVTGLSTEAPLFIKMEGLKPHAEFRLHEHKYVIQDVV